MQNLIINNKLFECSLGCHKYTIPDKKRLYILICKHCKRFGYYKGDYGYEEWYGYNKNGNIVHIKNSCGFERWFEYNKNGNQIYYKDNKGDESWFHKGKWVYKKPKDWEYE